MKNNSRIQIALNDVRAGRYREALAGFESQTNWIKSDTTLVHAAFVAARGAKEWALAENYLQRLVLLLPDRFEVHTTAGTFFQDQRRYGLAIQSFKRAIELKSSEPGLYYNLALALFDSQAFPEAKLVAEDAIRFKNNYYKAVVLLGRILNKLNLPDDSKELFLQAISIKPESYVGYFRLAEVSAEHGDLVLAEKNFEKALSLEPSNPEINAAIAESYLSLGAVVQAQHVIREGLLIDPAHPKLNRYSADLKFELGDSKAFDQYHHTTKGDVSSEVIGDYANRLLVVDDLVEAEKQIDILKSRFGEIDLYRELQVRLLLKQGNYDKALEHTIANADQLRHRPELKMESLLAIGEFVEAERYGRDLVRLDARNQFFWALFASALRGIDSPFYRQLMKYDQFIKINQLDPPEGFSSIEDFHLELNDYLNHIHETKNHPLGQSVRHGTQTTGNLMARKNPLINSLFKNFQKLVDSEFSDAFFDRLSLDHPLKLAQSKRRVITSGWSIRSFEGGFHQSHVHTKGFYSSAYYVDVPSGVRDGDSNDGALNFGAPGVNVAGDWPAEYVVKPKAGHLVLFPSYFWHGTTAFKGAGARLVVAFDVMLHDRV